MWMDGGRAHRTRPPVGWMVGKLPSPSYHGIGRNCNRIGKTDIIRFDHKFIKYDKLRCTHKKQCRALRHLYAGGGWQGCGS